jgi:hypothetical protein
MTEIRDLDGDGFIFTTEAHVSDHPEFSKLLGPNGKALRYKQPDPIGFRLKPKRDGE